MISEKSFSEKSVDEIVEETIGLVHFIVQRHFPHLVNTPHYDDAVQEGAIGLLNAIRLYDESSGNLFSTYAYNAIRGAVYKGIKDLTTPTAVPRGSYNVYKTFLELSEDGLSIEQVAKKLGMKISTLEGIINSYGYISLDKEVNESGDDKNIKLLDIIPCEEVEEDYSDYIRSCRTLLYLLTPTHRKIFQLYLEGFTQKKIAKTVGCSQVNVSRTLTRVVRDHLPIFKQYIEGDIAYGEMLLMLCMKPSNAREHLKCYIDYAMELANRGHRITDELLVALNELNFKEVKKFLSGSTLVPKGMGNLINVIDRYCSTLFIEEMILDMVDAYESGYLDSLY